MLAIFDIDGVLADDSKTAKLDPHNKTDLAKFEKLVPNLPTKDDIVRMARLLKMAGYNIIIFTARSEKLRKNTQDWLWGCGIDFNQLKMRAIGNNDNDIKLKLGMIDSLAKFWPDSMSIIYFENNRDVCTAINNNFKKLIREITVCEVR